MSLTRSITRSLTQPLTRRLTSPGMGGGAWSPARWFQSGEQGVWLDPSDLATMSQTWNGPLGDVAVGDPVGRIEDKSGNGNHATQSVSTKRLVLGQSGGLYYLEGAGGDDFISNAGLPYSAARTMMLAGHSLDAGTVNRVYGTASQTSIFDDGGTWKYFSNSISMPVSFSAASRTGPQVIGFQKPDETTAQLLAGSGLGATFVPYSVITTNGYALFAEAPTGGNCANARCYGLLIRNGPILSAEERVQGAAYLAAKAGVTL